MNEHKTDRICDKTTWAIGGGLLLGIAVGFFFFPPPSGVFKFVGCILGGLGFGLIVTAMLSTFSKNRP